MMRPALDDPALIKHVDHIGLLDRAESMRDGDRRAATSSGVQRSLDHFLRFRVESRGGFVEEKDFGITKESAGDGYALLLAAG